MRESTPVDPNLSSPILMYPTDSANRLIDIRSKDPIIDSEIPSDQLDAIRCIEAIIELRGSDHITIEGPPIYLWPNTEVTSCDWECEQFQSGWEFTQRLQSELQERTGMAIEHYQMVDDIHFRPEDSVITNDHAPTDISDASYAQSVTHAEYWKIFHEQVVQHVPYRNMLETHLGVMESTYKKNDDDTCARLDARFQMEKIQQAKGRRATHIVVHPIEFQRQQAPALVNTKALFAQDPELQKIPKKQRDAILLDSYVHVWTNPNGTIHSITQMQVHDGNYFFVPVDIDQLQIA